MLAADNNFRRLFLLRDDVNAGFALNHDATLPLHWVRRTAMVETGERSLMRFRPARAKPRIVGRHRHVRECGRGAEPSKNRNNKIKPAQPMSPRCAMYVIERRCTDAVGTLRPPMSMTAQ